MVTCMLGPKINVSCGNCSVRIKTALNRCPLSNSFSECKQVVEVLLMTWTVHYQQCPCSRHLEGITNSRTVTHKLKMMWDKCRKLCIYTIIRKETTVERIRISAGTQSSDTIAYNILLAVTLHRMGSTNQMVQEAATVAHQEVFWREDRPLLCLARFLYKNAYPCLCRWSALLLLWPPLHEFQWQYSKVQPIILCPCLQYLQFYSLWLWKIFIKSRHCTL